MAIEKRIELPEDTPLSANLPDDDVTVMPDGGAESTLENQK